MPRCFAIVALALLLALPASAQGFFYLPLAPGAVQAGLGEAVLTPGPDAFAASANPAALGVLEQAQIAGSFRSWTGDSRIYALAVALPTGERAGFGFYLMTFDQQTTTAGAEPQSEVPSGVFGAAYARRWGVVSVGAGARYLYERTFGQNASGLAADVAVLAEPVDGIVVSAAVQHVGRVSAIAGVRSPVPTTLRAGVAIVPFQLIEVGDNLPLVGVRLLAEVSRELEDGSSSPVQIARTRLHFGGEATAFELLTLRVGYVGGDTYAQRVTAGASIAHGPIAVSYAFQPLPDGFLSATSHVLSARYLF